MASLNYPYTFTNGTTADANQVMSDLNAVKTFVEGSVLQVDGSTGRPKLIIPHTFTVPGVVVVAANQADYLPPFFIKVPASQTVKLISARHRINSGTSATVSVKVNGVNATGFTSMSVTTSAADTNPTDISLADNDIVSITVDAISGGPQNMSVSLFFEYTWIA